ncbi:hypothetical protein [Clostridium sp.]|uniref:hypothetical protein n=2 Tax=Clostridium sp. TaxID=1506 RepID=UPI002FC6DB24
MTNKKRKVCAGSIVLYVIAAIILIYMFWAIANCHEYIAAMIAQGGMTFSGNEFNIINYYMANCAQYGLFAIVLIALGIIMQKLVNEKLNVTSNNVIIEETSKEVK